MPPPPCPPEPPGPHRVSGSGRAPSPWHVPSATSGTAVAWPSPVNQRSSRSATRAGAGARSAAHPIPGSVGSVPVSPTSNQGGTRRAKHHAGRTDADQRHPPSRPAGLRRTAWSPPSPGPTASTSTPPSPRWPSGPSGWPPPSPVSGSGADDRVGTFMWNNQRHLEAYLAVPSMGAVLHTLNVRLFPEQLAYVINHGEDQVIIVDAIAGPAAGPGPGPAHHVKHVIVVGDGDGSGDPRWDPCSLRGAAGAEEPGFDWPRARRTPGGGHVLHLGHHRQPQGRGLQPPVDVPPLLRHHLGGRPVGVNEQDRVLAIVPMFHANAWGTPYAAFMTGADLVMPQQFLQAAPLAADHRRLPAHHRRRASPPSGTTCSATPRRPSGGHVVAADDHGRGCRRAPVADRAVRTSSSASSWCRAGA